MFADGRSKNAPMRFTRVYFKKTVKLFGKPGVPNSKKHPPVAK